jgi:hypothetical protein
MRQPTSTEGRIELKKGVARATKEESWEVQAMFYFWIT